MQIRGGSRRVGRKGPKGSLMASKNYWSKTWKSATSTLKKPFKALRKPDFLKSKVQKQQEELTLKMRTTPIRSVVAPNSTLVPQDVLQIAAKRSGLLGNPLRPQAVQDLANSIKQWYTRKGYLLSSVTGATLQLDTQTAELTVEEPLAAAEPIKLWYYKEMVIDPEDNSTVTFRQYKSKHVRRKTLGYDRISKADLNTTFVPSTEGGRTSPRRIAQALQLQPNQPFRWIAPRWDAVRRSRIFRRVFMVSPARMPDGTVQVHVGVEESPWRHLEYGLSKSLYTGSWEGAVEFDHANLLGGGESLGVTVRRGTHDAEPSVRLRFSDDKFGLEGGYDVEVFTDYLGESMDNKGDDETADEYDADDLLDRKGASFEVRNPIDPNRIRHSSLRACIERTFTKGGRHESIGSACLRMGPFRRDLPLDARSNVVGSVTTGARVSETSWKVLPYTSVTATTRHIFPLSSISDKPWRLALQHTLSTATRSLPRHEANSMGIAANVRGYTPKAEAVSSSIVGTTELRIPIKIPKINDADATLILFGDWCLAQRSSRNGTVRKSSVGVGLRKSLQGIPLKLDMSYRGDGKIRSAVGLGADFDVQ